MSKQNNEHDGPGTTVQKRPFRQCSRCVLDTTVEDIVFDETGVCNYCKEYDKKAAATVGRQSGVIEQDLKRIISEIKEEGKGKKYDCILGLSGGVDSTYMALLASRFGLRPLIVHFDNGWNSELAVSNIENVVKRLGFDLYTVVINWEEFRDLQLAYLKASVVDIEVPTDQLIFASLFRLARKKRIRTILSGSNIVTEGIIPRNWNYFDKTDLVNLKNIHAKYGTLRLRDFPTLGLYQRFIYRHFHNVRTVPVLNYVNYVKADAKKEIQRELAWRDYGGKHYESVFTRFYQGYILPQKFGIDKRKMHLSTLICSGQMTRDEALQILSEPGYDPAMYRSDREFVLKKLGLSEDEFEAIMAQKPVPHAAFDTQWDPKHFRKYFWFTKVMKPIARVWKLIRLR